MRQVFLFFCLLGCAKPLSKEDSLSLVKSELPKEKGIVIQYDSKKDRIRLKVKNQPMSEVLRRFSEFTGIDIWFSEEEVAQRVSFETPMLPVLKALEYVVKKNGFLLERAKVGIGFVVKPRWVIPSWKGKELSRRIRFASTKAELGELFYLHDPKYFQPYVGGMREKKLSQDLYYAYRPILQELLWRHVPLLRKKQYYLPKRIENIEKIRAFYRPSPQEVVTEAVILSYYPYVIHVVFRFSFVTLTPKGIVLFVTATKR